MERPLYVVIEGIDGSGITTQAELLSKSMNKPTVLTAEPTNSKLGQMLRGYLQHTHQIQQGVSPYTQVDVESETLALLFTADRTEHWYAKDSGIIDLLRQGKTVISGRSYYSSIAMQSRTVADIRRNQQLNSTFPVPDVTIYLESTVECSVGRIISRGADIEMFETADRLGTNLERYERMWDCTDVIVNRVDATGSIDGVAAKINKAVTTRVRSARSTILERLSKL